MRGLPYTITEEHFPIYRVALIRVHERLPRSVYSVDIGGRVNFCDLLSQEHLEIDILCARLGSYFPGVGRWA